MAIVNLLLLLCCLTGLLGAQSLAIFAGPVGGVAPWDPDSIQEGIGGSEEAIIYVSHELAQMGYQVTVFGDVPPDSRHSDPGCNPRYLNLDHETARFDVGIVWRMPWLVELVRSRARQLYFWPHDVYTAALGKLYTDPQIHQFDGVLWLSDWQSAQWTRERPHFGDLPHQMCGNGIQPTQFMSVIERTNPYACIYASNYTRGLSYLLDIWPIVHHLFPRATLDIYYGWTPDVSSELRAHLEQQFQLLEPLGVRHHGRVGHQQLNQAFAQASFWTYPCLFDETFCITALRAQFSGAIPVVLHRAALKETVRYGYVCEASKDYLPMLIVALTEAESTPLSDRQKMSQFILEKHTWHQVATRWNALFRGKVLR
jgi:glycosyltransferase involved in cell wall biosynthesis